MCIPFVYISFTNVQELFLVSLTFTTGKKLVWRMLFVPNKASISVRGLHGTWLWDESDGGVKTLSHRMLS